MPVTLSIKNTPVSVVERLKRRASRHHRSLQGELLALVGSCGRVEVAVREGSAAATLGAARGFPVRLRLG